MIVKVVDCGPEPETRGDHFYSEVQRIRVLAGFAILKHITEGSQDLHPPASELEVRLVEGIDFVTSSEIPTPLLHTYWWTSLLYWYGGQPVLNVPVEVKVIEMLVERSGTEATKLEYLVVGRHTCCAYLLNDQGKTIERLN
jgi:hypothetical protein